MHKRILGVLAAVKQKKLPCMNACSTGFSEGGQDVASIIARDYRVEFSKEHGVKELLD